MPPAAQACGELARIEIHKNASRQLQGDNQQYSRAEQQQATMFVGAEPIVEFRAQRLCQKENNNSPHTGRDAGYQEETRRRHS